jgi:Domain of unknown function (DUF397)
MSPVRERDTAALSLFADEMKAARDSKDPDGARLAFGREAWQAFAAKVKADIN